MEVNKLRALVIFTVVLGMLVGQSSATFKDCYAKCFLTCMIEPSQNLCTCTTSCLKNCIFPDAPESVEEQVSDNQNFCKLGCAFSMCSGVSSEQKPNVERVDNCVGSCSKTCTKSYSSP